MYTYKIFLVFMHFTLYKIVDYWYDFFWQYNL